jgi:hypothetical protein
VVCNSQLVSQKISDRSKKEWMGSNGSAKAANSVCVVEHIECNAVKDDDDIGS